MKKMTIISMFLIFISVIKIFSCDISVDTDKKEYHVDDYVIFTVVLTQDHRNCLHEGEEPLVKINGLELIGKTNYTEIKDGVWQIKYKAKITNDSPIFIVQRVCEKGGDQEKIVIHVS